MGGMESQRITRDGQTVLPKFMESQIWHPPAGLWLCGRRVLKRNNHLCLPFCLGESCPPVLAIVPDTSFPSYMPLYPSSAALVLEFRGNESGCLFFKRNCLELQKFLPPTQSMLVFAARSYEDLSSWHWNPGLGSSCGAVTPCS